MIGFPRAPQSSRKRGEKRRGRESSRRARRSTCQRRRRETPPRTQRKGWGKRAPSGGKLPPSSPRFCALLFLGSAAAKPLLAGTPRLVCFFTSRFHVFLPYLLGAPAHGTGRAEERQRKAKEPRAKIPGRPGKGGEKRKGVGREETPSLSSPLPRSSCATSQEHLVSVLRRKSLARAEEREEKELRNSRESLASHPVPRRLFPNAFPPPAPHPRCFLLHPEFASLQHSLRSHLWS